MNYADIVDRKLANVSRISSTVGVFVSMVGTLARVNVQGATVDIRCDGWYPPIPGMPVRVETVNSIMRVVGPSQTLSPRGDVVESLEGGTRALVEIDEKRYNLPVLAPYSPLVTDVVIVNWQSGHVLGEEASAPETVPPPSTGGGGGQPFAGLVIQPTASGKYDTNWDNWWSPPEVWASNNNKGIWTFAGRFTALAGASISKIEFHFPTPIKVTGAAFIGLHSYPAIPGGEPNITDLIAVPADRRVGWLELPVAWGNHLRDNPNAGIGVTSGGGDNRWPGVGQRGGEQSGWLRFDGSR